MFLVGGKNVRKYWRGLDRKFTDRVLLSRKKWPKTTLMVRSTGHLFELGWKLECRAFLTRLKGTPSKEELKNILGHLTIFIWFWLVKVASKGPSGQQDKYEVRSPKYIWAPVYSCTHWLRPRNYPLPPHLGSYTRARYWSAMIYRRHLFVTPCPARLGRFESGIIENALVHSSTTLRF
jgi:hypothetical protein